MNENKKYKLKLINNTCLNYDTLPTILPPAKRIIAIGDIHGDLFLAKKYLIIAKIIDEDFNWIAEPKETIVVQIGDQIDRCRPYKYTCDNPKATIDDEASDIKILKLFTLLHQKAKKYGGAVYSLLGNHEFMNVEGNMMYVSNKGLKEFEDYVDPENPQIKFNSGEEARKHAFKIGNEYSKFLACTRIGILIIGSFLFVHAGILPILTKKYNINKKEDLENINELIKKWLLGIIKKNNLTELIDNDKVSPFWTRVLGIIPPKTTMKNESCKKYVKPILDLYKLNGIVIGHTPQFYQNNEGLNSTCDDSLWRIDTGTSKAFDVFDTNIKISKRNVQILEIINDEKINIIKE